MLRLVKYLKPYLLLILIAIALLFVQANADLALPDYMSKIVNYGIQQGGVVECRPDGDPPERDEPAAGVHERR